MINSILTTGIISVIGLFIITLISNGLHDFKQIFFLKGRNILKAVILADIYAVFNNLVIKSVAETNPILVNIITVISVSISITAAMLYSEKQMKEYVYTYTIITKFKKERFELKDLFFAHQIPYQYDTYYNQNSKDDLENEEVNEFGETLYHRYEVVSFSKEFSQKLESILSPYEQKRVKWKRQDSSYTKEK